MVEEIRQRSEMQGNAALYYSSKISDQFKFDPNPPIDRELRLPTRCM